ncbi:WW domain binding protein 1-like [Pomacea canaliculata]|uniref:WW domain binding protein 1-like n=1 Tax=Pomacea canaliculata TaxID=400727 RepID=UPI000D7263E2|nr:WW domain binding protein 1-like [Pomacea canaliculata]
MKTMLPHQFSHHVGLSILGYFPVLSVARTLTDTTCGGIHCYGSTQCCGNGCCLLSIYEQAWFWIVLVLGLLALLVVLVLTCRWLCRFHNANQYNKLRLQQQPEQFNYGTVRYRALTDIPPPSYNQEDDSMLPSYAAVTSKPPPYCAERSTNSVS